MRDKSGPQPHHVWLVLTDAPLHAGIPDVARASNILPVGGYINNMKSGLQYIVNVPS
jgi:hypothetical protein